MEWKNEVLETKGTKKKVNISCVLCLGPYNIFVVKSYER